MEPRSFALEHLEGRALFSVAAPVHAAPMSAPAALHPALHHRVLGNPLAGSFNAGGTYTHPFSPNPDAGSHYLLTGSGKQKTIGAFTLSGDLKGPGFVAMGQTTGYITLTTAKGTIVLKVHSEPQPPGSLPSSLTFSIVGGTGTYSRVSGKGHIALSASDSTKKFVFRFNPA